MTAVTDVRPIGIIGAMDDEVEGLIARLDGHAEETVCGVKFHTGTIFSKPVVIARCGVGKVFAAVCTTAMIMKYSPRLVVNTGVAGALSESLACADTVVARRLVQYDMDTSAVGDPIGLVSGINRVFFEADARAADILESSARALGIPVKRGDIATGDKFVSDAVTKAHILAHFPSSLCCEMEGAALAHAAYVGGTPFAVVRAISDGANGDSPLDFPSFLKIAAKNSTALTLSLVEGY